MKSIVKANILNDQLVYRRKAGAYKQPSKFRQAYLGFIGALGNMFLKLKGL